MDEYTEQRYRQIMKSKDGNQPSIGPAPVVFIGFVCSLISLIIFPPAFAIAGVVCGVVVVAKRNEILGVVVIILSIIFGIIGMVAGYYMPLR